MGAAGHGAGVGRAPGGRVGRAVAGHRRGVVRPGSLAGCVELEEVAGCDYAGLSKAAWLLGAGPRLCAVGAAEW